MKKPVGLCSRESLFSKTGWVTFGPPRLCVDSDLCSRCLYTGENLLMAPWAEEPPPACCQRCTGTSIDCHLLSGPFSEEARNVSCWAEGSFIPSSLRGSLVPTNPNTRWLKTGPLHPCPSPTWTAEPSTNTNKFLTSSMLLPKSKEQHILLGLSVHKISLVRHQSAGEQGAGDQINLKKSFLYP